MKIDERRAKNVSVKGDIEKDLIIKATIYLNQDGYPDLDNIEKTNGRNSISTYKK